MEGTIFRKLYKDSDGNTAPSLWQYAAEQLGPEAAEAEKVSKQKWNNGEYSGYVEWMEADLKIHQKFGITKQFFENILKTVHYHPYVKETFQELKKRGYRTGLVSGGFKAQANRAQIDLKIDHAFAACEQFWGHDGKLIHWNLLPCDYEGKIDFMNLIMEEHGLKPEACAFVGDGRNDIPLAKAVGLSIAFNGAKELQNVCTHAINQEEGKEDFRAILKFF